MSSINSGIDGSCSIHYISLKRLRRSLARPDAGLTRAEARVFSGAAPPAAPARSTSEPLEIIVAQPCFSRVHQCKARPVNKSLHEQVSRREILGSPNPYAAVGPRSGRRGH